MFGALCVVPASAVQFVRHRDARRTPVPAIRNVSLPLRRGIASRSLISLPPRPRHSATTAARRRNLILAVDGACAAWPELDPNIEHGRVRRV